MPSTSSRSLIVAIALIGLAWPSGALWAAPAADSGSSDADFLRDVRPILSSHCFKCHGPDEKTRKADLRLDTPEGAVAPAKSGRPAVVPGKVAESELIKRVESTDADEVMPPPATKHVLTDREKKVLRRWIEKGGEYRPHWAFVPPQRPAVPAVPSGAGGPAQPVDAFIRARLSQEGLQPMPEADRVTLIRRLSLDLIGLPPTPEEVDAFVRDNAPNAYERLVDRLLGSEHYGERWARRWMDLARYADTNGYEKDRVRSMWPWRDWLIAAFNADKPFDQFTVEQVAGDLLPSATAEQRIATGFNRNTMINEEGGIDPLEYRFHAMVDRVHTTATTWLGMTFACAQCHTHKYDPIQQREYYQFMAFLDNADEPVMDVPKPDIAERRAKAEARVAELEASLADRFPPDDRTTLVTPAAEEVEATSTSERLSDGSYRFGGPVPPTEVVTFRFKPGVRQVSLVVIEALADDALPKKGPGRAPNGNFVLSEVEIQAGDSNGASDLKPIRIASAEADFEQGGFTAANAVDGKTETGWAVSGEGAWNINRRLVARFAEPVDDAEGKQFRIRLVQNHGSQHVLGRVRVSFGSEPPDARPLEQRRREHFERRFAAWVAREADKARKWVPLTALSATSTVPVLTIEKDATVFASSDMTKSDAYELAYRSELKGITAIRLEALTDDRLPRRGPGRVYYEGPFGDFFLSTFSVTASGVAVPLVRPSQTFASGGNDASKALDDDAQSGWAIDGGQGRDHAAVFNLAKPLEDASHLGARLLFEKYYAAGLGRFRVSVTTDPRGAEAMDLSDELQAVLALPSDRRTPDQEKALRRKFAAVAPELASARAEVARLGQEMPAFPTTLVMQERPSDNPRATLIRNRGDFLQPTDRVTAALPAVFAHLAARQPGNRLDFARWLVSRENPLTARVTVNRQWQAFFGRGLVTTMEDFGFQGELPTHPELLDWLAVEFMDHGWSLKALNKTLVMSATYRQSSKVLPASLEKDPQNRWLSRGPRFRIEAELVRDLALSVSGLLSPKVGGPSVFPPQLASITKEGTYGPLEWKVSEGEDRYRRGVYTFAKRTAPYATFGTFDAPSGEACTARRELSNTPLQALTLLNDEVFMEAARALGSKASTGPGDLRERAADLFRRCLARSPSGDELERLLKFYEAQRQRWAKGAGAAEELAGQGQGDAADRAAWTAVARALLNLDETVTSG
ncbi:MAG: PSD1 domain-containing protein [Verrucomicrobiales bacterium]|nr:PSD1 domain-containing protein [Verrucomicrobiales bacterium]